MFTNVRKTGTWEPGEVRQIPENGQKGKTDFESGCWGSVLLNWLYLEGKERDRQIHILNKLWISVQDQTLLTRIVLLPLSLATVCLWIGGPLLPCLCCLICKMKISVLILLIKHSETHW